MAQSRRVFLQSALLSFMAGLVSVLSHPLSAWGKTGSAKLAGPGRLDQAVSQELGQGELRETDGLSLEAPQTAEDGAVVPITVESRLPDVETILIFVEKNPVPLAARFQFDPSMDAFVSLRIKMNESSDVIAVVKSGDDYFGARRKVKVVVGGCG